MNVNKTITGGRLVRDVELRFTASNTAVANFSIATNRRTKNKETGAWEDAPPVFVEITAWAKSAEAIARHFGKGDEILVFGRLEKEEWSDRQTGDKRSKMKVVCEEFQFCGPKQDRQPAGAGQSQGYGGNQGSAPGGVTPTDEDIPFAALLNVV